MAEDTTGDAGSASPISSIATTPDRSLRRVRLIALVAALSGCVVLAAAFVPWFRSSSSLAQDAISAPANQVCASAGGVVVQNAQGFTECAVWDVSITGKGLADQSANAARATGITRNIAYQKLPSTTAGLPSPTFWALMAALLVVVAVAAHSMIAAVLAPLASLLSWGALSKFAAYAQDPQHGGAFVEQVYGVTLTKVCIGLVTVTAVAGGTAVVRARMALWRDRQAQGLPATALATVIRGAVTRTLAEAARTAQDPH